jgi:hypothetical protein
MVNVDRRSAAVLGLAATIPALTTVTSSAAAATYGPKAGEEVAPGVREVFLHKREVSLSAYKWAWLTDLIFQPGASIALDVVPNDTICLMVEGLLRVKLDEQEFIVTKNEHPLWASHKGAMERRSNTGADVAVVRVIDLLPR